MNEAFHIAVILGGDLYEFKARFERWDDTHRVAVLIGETTFVFEPDENGKYQALTELPVSTDTALLKVVAEKLSELGNV